MIQCCLLPGLNTPAYTRALSVPDSSLTPEEEPRSPPLVHLHWGPSLNWNASLSCREYQQHLCPGLHQWSTDLEWPFGPGEPSVQSRLHPDREGKSWATSMGVEGMPTPSLQKRPRRRLPGGASLLLFHCSDSWGSWQHASVVVRVMGLLGT